jgi:hypothetical protein
VTRIHVIGAPSAGKSTLAQELGRSLGIPVCPLDPIAYTDDRWTTRPLPEREHAVQSILSQESWITEGGQLGWTQPLLMSADLIIWLDLPLLTLLRRHFGRHRPGGVGWLVARWWFQVRYHFALRGETTGDGELPPNRRSAAAALAPVAEKVRRCRRAPSSAVVLSWAGDEPEGGGASERES